MWQYVYNGIKRWTCICWFFHSSNTLCHLQLILYRRAHFTPPGAKYLILDDFHFRIDPQIINYNGLSFHTSTGLPELGQAAGHRPPSRPLGPDAWPRPGGLGGGGPAPAHVATARPHRLSRRDSDSWATTIVQSQQKQVWDRRPYAGLQFAPFHWNQLSSEPERLGVTFCSG
jgi:hypothetical protein